MVLADAENGSGEVQCTDFLAVPGQLIPLDVRSVGGSVLADVADLPDAESTVEEMLEGMADQIKQMVGVAQRPDGDAVDGVADSPVRGTPEEPVQISVSGGFRREEMPVEFDVQRTLLLPVGDLVGRIPKGGIHIRRQAELCENVLACSGLGRIDQKIFVTGDTVIRLGIQVPTDDALDNQRTDPGIGKGLHQGQEFCGFPGLDHHLLEHTAPQCRQGRISLKLRKGMDGFEDHGKHMVDPGHPEYQIPLFPAQLRRLVRCCASEGTVQAIQKTLADAIHGSHLRFWNGVIIPCLMPGFNISGDNPGSFLQKMRDV